MEKTCSRCGKTQPLSEFYRRKNVCKECQRTYSQTYYAANRDRLRATSAAWRKANPERAAATQKAWREANPGRATASSRAWKEANPERAAATRKAWREANPERAAATRKAWREANPERAVDSQLRSDYGISLADYDEMLEAQDNGCAICGKTEAEEGKRLAVDHNHETDQVRGLLCGNCNQAIGKLGHDPERLRNAIAYLEQWGQG